MSQLHCQAGSDLTVFTLKAFLLEPATRITTTRAATMTTAKPSENEEEAEETFVTVKQGEEKTQIDITENRTFDAVRAKYAEIKSLNPSEIQFIFGAGPVVDYSKNVIPGTTILARRLTGGRRKQKATRASRRSVFAAKTRRKSRRGSKN